MFIELVYECKLCKKHFGVETEYLDIVGRQNSIPDDRQIVGTESRERWDLVIAPLARTKEIHHCGRGGQGIAEMVGVKIIGS